MRKPYDCVDFIESSDTLFWGEAVSFLSDPEKKDDAKFPIVTPADTTTRLSKKFPRLGVMSYEEVGKILNLTKARVQRIECNALGKLAQKLRPFLKEFES